MSDSKLSPVLTIDLKDHPAITKVIDSCFKTPVGLRIRDRSGKLKWEEYTNAGKKAFGKEMPFFYSAEQFAASMDYPDKDLADQCEVLRNTPAGCVLPLGKDAAGYEWGTNFTHFNYKSLELAETITALAASMLRFRKCNKQRHFFYYPRGSYREWHTNEASRSGGWRVYLIKAKNSGKSYFNYLEDDQLIRSPDTHYCLRIFRFGSGINLYHSVCAQETDRWSYGINPLDWPFESTAELWDYLKPHFEKIGIGGPEQRIA